MSFFRAEEVLSLKDMIKSQWRFLVDLGLSVISALTIGDYDEDGLFHEDTIITKYEISISYYFLEEVNGENTTIKTEIETGYLNESKYQMSPSFSTSLVQYLQGDAMPPFIIKDEYESSSCGRSMYSIKITINRLPRKDKKFDIPDYLKKLIIDTNYRTRKNEININTILKGVHSNGLYSYLKSLLPTSLYNQQETGEIATREGELLLPSIISSADVGLDTIDLIVDLTDYIASVVERSNIETIKKKEEEILELLTDDEKLNKTIGDALNSGTTEEVICKNSNGTYDFSKYLCYLDDGVNKFYVSKDVKDLMPFREWKGDI